MRTIILALVCFVAGAFLPSPGRAQGVADQKYCPGSSTIAALNSAPVDSAPKVAAACKPGDIILLPTNAIGLIGIFCDMSRPSIVTSGNVLCTMAKQRDIRR